MKGRASVGGTHEMSVVEVECSVEVLFALVAPIVLLATAPVCGRDDYGSVRMGGGVGPIMRGCVSHPMVWA